MFMSCTLACPNKVVGVYETPHSGFKRELKTSPYDQIFYCQSFFRLFPVVLLMITVFAVTLLMCNYCALSTFFSKM